MDYIKVNNKRIAIDKNVLYLESFNIGKISEIKRLKRLSNLIL